MSRKRSAPPGKHARKSKKKGRPRPASPVPGVPQAPAPGGPGPAAAITPPPTPARARPTPASQIDYHYVISDLRRISLIAGAMFGLLILLTLFIR